MYTKILYTNKQPNMKIKVISELNNIAPRFKKAIWRKIEIGMTYSSKAEAQMYHNLHNCHYAYINDSDEIASEYNNAKIDRYGKRYR